MEPVDTHILNINSNSGDTSLDGIPDGNDAFRINFDDLEFGEEIGKGAYGKIFKGEYFGTPVGIKEIALSPNSDKFKDLLKFIKREVAMLRFSHPNLLTPIGVAERGQNVYIVNEFVSGGDLAYYLFKTKYDDPVSSFIHKKVNIGSSSIPEPDITSEKLIEMSWPLRVKIAYDVACAMTYLHSRNVIHRDLKSSNLLVGECWKIKVCDMGFARSTNSAQRSIRGNHRLTICGTNNWMSPEVILGQPYDNKCDVFSFGIVLSEIITRLETSAQLRPISLKYGLDVDVLLPKVPKDCPAPLLKLALDCVEFEPSLRPTFKEITERLKSLLNRKLLLPSALPPLRVLAPSPAPSPLPSPRTRGANNPNDDLESDLDSDDETEDDSLDELSSLSSLSRSSSSSSFSATQKHPTYHRPQKMGYIIKHINIGFDDHASGGGGGSVHLLSQSPTRGLSPISAFSPPPPNSISSSNSTSSNSILRSPPPPPTISNTLNQINAGQINKPKPHCNSPLRGNTTEQQELLPLPSRKQIESNDVEQGIFDQLDQLSKSLQQSIWTPVTLSPSNSPTKSTSNVHINDNVVYSNLTRAVHS
ncbi:LISK family protein kinase [Cavenderia fasciculata]|uniref:non-specific serine/threonine protein kinase n=1 Tax=Cavenderia fasciculata TaxID=261658 RepID=F4Q5M5_CACFS|nr:LISK family protein kinase [Cavenderia fasciculata]EGG17284.1 LISK family protein kinase [Cavenderia fasciculata]|eukprot:XP_004355768.1 LISK family protein kinase [Cavenderia fasciculata]